MCIRDSFKPALARDYDVFFAAIGLLCGGILFFQGWRLDPILQFGQFLLAGTTVFFAYESVRLRGVATDQARRTSFFEDDPISDLPRNSRGRYDDYDRFEEADRPTRRFKPQEDEFEEDFSEGRSRRRNVSRAIPSAAVSRSRSSTREANQFENDEPIRRRRQNPDNISTNQPQRNNFGERRNLSRNEVKTGSRPRMNRTVSRKDNISTPNDSSPSRRKPARSPIREQTSTAQVEDASFQDANQVKKTRDTRRASSSARSSSKNQTGRYTVGTNKKKPRDNSSRFDD